MKVGILTGGGDAPGLNAVIRAVVKRGIKKYGFDLHGIQTGWLGLVEGRVEPLDFRKVSGIIDRGGTIIGTARKNPLKNEEDKQKLIANLKKFGFDAIIAIGGEDTLGVAAKLHEMKLANVVGVPKTIDNDIPGTDYTFGFDTAASIATEAIDRLQSTAEAHRRIMVVEVMGRHAGWIAAYSGIACGADFILVPEVPFDIAEICESLKRRHAAGAHYSIVVCAEGAQPKQNENVIQDGKVDEFGHVHLGGIGQMLGKEIEKRTGVETRVVVLGHLQRGGTPTAFDRVLATRYGVAAIDLVAEKNYGNMVSFLGNKITHVPITQVLGKLRTLDLELYETAKVFFA